MTDIERLHHAAYRCRDSEKTRTFYEDFLGLKLVNALTIATKSSEPDVLHAFYAMKDGSCLAFFEEPNTLFDFKTQRDFALHIALQVNKEALLTMMERWRKVVQKASRHVALRIMGLFSQSTFAIPMVTC